jgi:dTDP-4-dehydrorhamnose reductase
MSKPLILLTGCFGQLGTAIQRCWDTDSLSTDYELLPVDANQLDLTDALDVSAYLDQLKPRYVINTAAYTRVDDAESDAEAAFALNGDAVSVLAQWCSRHNCTLIQISTDFVFDGRADAPYLPEAATGPLSVYGASKLAGEHHVRDRLPHDGIIVRTAWLYSEFGSNFVKTMLRLMGERHELRVVNDQIGSPTSAHTLARFILTLVKKGTTHGVFHWTDGAEISWFEFARAIYEAGRSCQLLANDVSIQPIQSSEYPTPAVRPAYSVLDRTSSLALIDEAAVDWRVSLNHVIENLALTASSAGT